MLHLSRNQDSKGSEVSSELLLTWKQTQSAHMYTGAAVNEVTRFYNKAEEATNLGEGETGTVQRDR